LSITADEQSTSKAGLVFPEECAGVFVDAVDVVIETAGDQAIADDWWCGFEDCLQFCNSKRGCRLLRRGQ
jgi:hypothetical protein